MVERRDGLAGAGLADDPERASARELVADPVDGVHETVLGGQLDAQVLDAQQRGSAGVAVILGDAGGRRRRRVMSKRTRGSRNA